MTDPKMNPWHPMTDPVDLKHLGKLIEELGELQAAAARCVIQGINEYEPVTGKLNQVWLEEELADVLAGIHLTVTYFNLDHRRIVDRVKRKKVQLKLWHEMA